ncbi:hypothetical protein NKH18_31840 [Streptomyces sp. M10(2022)]
MLTVGAMLVLAWLLHRYVERWSTPLLRKAVTASVTASVAPRASRRALHGPDQEAPRDPRDPKQNTPSAQLDEVTSSTIRKTCGA